MVGFWFWVRCFVFGALWNGLPDFAWLPDFSKNLTTGSPRTSLKQSKVGFRV